VADKARLFLVTMCAEVVSSTTASSSGLRLPHTSTGCASGVGGAAGSEELPTSSSPAFSEADAVTLAGVTLAWLEVLQSSTIKATARRDRNSLSAFVLDHMKATGAKAKPILRVLYSWVGNAGMHHGFASARAMFTSLGAEYIHQNKVRAVTATHFIVSIHSYA
jgi:hypothetical protein